jgi:hypothetical protein
MTLLLLLTQDAHARPWQQCCLDCCYSPDQTVAAEGNEQLQADGNV